MAPLPLPPPSCALTLPIPPSALVTCGCALAVSTGCGLWLYFQAPEKPRSGEIRWPSGSVLAHAARHRVRAIQPEVLPQRRAGPRTGRADRDQQFAKQCAAGHRGRRSLRFAVGVGPLLGTDYTSEERSAAGSTVSPSPADAHDLTSLRISADFYCRMLAGLRISGDFYCRIIPGLRISADFYCRIVLGLRISADFYCRILEGHPWRAPSGPCS